MKKRLFIFFSFLLLAQEVFAQCAMCKAVAEDGIEEEANNINTGIIYIMLIPYIILLIAFRKKIFGMLKEIWEIPQVNGTKKPID
ncbi:MAG: hypothetical protein MI810_03180 [Flavobacteriales bacterium]|nr:hypothetical protein [Flavobacteriales bacterium]